MDNKRAQWLERGLTRPLNYDRNHQPISWEAAGRLLMDINARRIAETKVGDLIVSTVFLVSDHGPTAPAPVLYETMVFYDGECDDTYTERYYTAEAALAGHDQVVAELKYLASL